MLMINLWINHFTRCRWHYILLVTLLYVRLCVCVCANVLGARKCRSCSKWWRWNCVYLSFWRRFCWRFNGRTCWTTYHLKSKCNKYVKKKKQKMVSINITSLLHTRHIDSHTHTHVGTVRSNTCLQTGIPPITHTHHTRLTNPPGPFLT